MRFSRAPGAWLAILATIVPGKILLAQPTSSSAADVVSGGGIITTLVLVNTASVDAQTHVAFSADDGSPLIFPLKVTQTGATLIAASLDQTIPAHATLRLETTGQPGDLFTSGSAQVTSDQHVSGYVLYTYANGQEAAVPLETRASDSYYIPIYSVPPLQAFTGIAIANLASNAVTVTANMRGSGVFLGLGTITIPARGHTAFLADQKFSTFPLESMLELRTPAPGQISVMGLGFTPAGVAAFPVLTNTGPFSGSIAQIAYTSDTTSAFALVNIGSATAKTHVQFLNDEGQPQSWTLAVPGCPPLSAIPSSTLDRDISIGNSCGVVALPAAIPAVPAVGWAQISSDAGIAAYVSYTVRGNIFYTPIETGAASSFVLPFDNTNNVVTGIALANLTSGAGSVQVTVRDESGAQIAAPLTTGPIGLNAQGHTSFGLAQLFPFTANRRGTAEFSSVNGGAIGVLGLRFSPNGSINNIPVWVP